MLHNRRQTATALALTSIPGHGRADRANARYRNDSKIITY
jgi:hypothetical protein